VNPQVTRTGPRRRCLLAAFAAVAALAAAPPARADALQPVVQLGPVAVANGSVTVSGHLGGVPSAGATLTVNGSPVGVTSTGHFQGIVNLNGASAVTIAASNPVTGETATISIPLTALGPGGLVPPDIMSALERAAMEILKPIDGFKSFAGLPLIVRGSVADRSHVAGMSVNGVDVMRQLGNAGSFAVPIPGSSREIVVSVTDDIGVEQTNTYPVTPISPVIRTRAGRSVSARAALGVRVASVRYLTKRARGTKRVRMLVTVKDRRGYLVRGAAVTVSSLRRGHVSSRVRTKRTNRAGAVSFVVRLRPSAFGRRLATITIARTPTAKAKRTTSVRLPKLNVRNRAGRR
jgi:hypothetical protein